MDKELENILKKANKDQKPVKEKIVKVFPPSEPYSYLVFKKLTRFGGFEKIVFLLILPVCICTLLLIGIGVEIVLLCLSIYGALLLIYFIINYFRFQRFKGWQKRLPFSLEGWNEMIHTKKMYCDLCWNHTRITVEQNGNDEIKKVIEAALKLFCKRSQKAYYWRIPESGGNLTHRNDWKLTSNVSAEGSANPEVMMYMKDLFEREFSIIALKTNSISKVKVELLSDEFQVDIEISVD